MADTWRLFIAIDLPANIVSHLNDVQNWLKSRTARGAVRWVKPESIHLTLKFLGDVPEAYRTSIQGALEQAVDGHAPFKLAAGELGCFPSPRRPRVAWVGIQHDLTALHALRDSIETHITPLGYATDDRPFHPHLTLGRVRRDTNRQDAQKLGDLLQQDKFSQPQTWGVTQVTLFRSELTPQGAVYTPLFNATLADDA